MSRNSQATRKAKIAKKKEKVKKVQAKINQNKLQIVDIYLDESGNTGHNIVDNSQPMFTLAGLKHSDQQASLLLELLQCKSPLEAHFKNLKRRKAGQDGIVRLMKHSLINPDLVRVELIHKKFMITARSKRGRMKLILKRQSNLVHMSMGSSYAYPSARYAPLKIE